MLKYKVLTIFTLWVEKQNKAKYSYQNAGASFDINEIHPFATMDTLMKHTN